jgi:hypothetical protein
MVATSEKTRQSAFLLEEGFGHARGLLVRMQPSPAGYRDGPSRPSKRLFHCRSDVTSRSVSVVSTTKMASRLARSVALAFSLMG